MDELTKQVGYTFIQDADCSCNSDSNYINIRTEDCGGGAYIIIETQRWALDPKDIDIFCYRLKEILKEAK